MNKKIVKKFLVIAYLFVAIALAFGINTTTASAKTVKAKSITLSKSSVSLKKGKSITLKATIKPKNTTQKKIVWSTSKKTVATVSSKGVVKAKGNGTATITATVKGTKIKAKCKVKVTTPVSKVVLSGEDTVKVGESIKLKAKITPSKASNKNVVFTTSDKKIATVTSKGKVKGKSEGTVTITATAVDGSKKKAKKVIKVENPVIEASDISIDKQECELFVGKTDVLVATISPEDATDKTITWSTTDDTIVTVDAKGKITAMNPGNAQVSASTVNGLVATCNITVVDKMCVTNEAELIAVLSDIDRGTIEIKTDEESIINIPSGSYTNINLVINTPNAEIINNARFNSITIAGIENGSYTEKAIGNTLTVTAEKSKITIEKDAAASLEVNEGVKEISINENGEISSLNVKAAALVNIEGTSEGSKNIDTTVCGEGSKIVTTKPLDITPDSKITLILRAGAEETQITVETEDIIPDMQGTESVKVHINSTGTDIKKETEALEDQYLARMTFTGNAEDSVTKGIISGTAYLVQYTEEMDIENIDTIEGVTTFDVTDGKYSCEDVKEGSYVFMIKSEGYKDFIQMIVITSKYGAIFENTDARIVPVTDNDDASFISGNILDSANKEGIEGITVSLIKHKNNKVSRPIMDTLTDISGYYSFTGIPSGNYTIQVSDNRVSASKKFVSTTFDVCINNGQVLTKGTAMSEELNPDEVRFVLTWGSDADEVLSDADAYLYGPSEDGSIFLTSFYSNEHRVNGVLKTLLDVDQREYNGPETITIKEKEDGIYDYYVHAYSDDGTIGTSQMRVDVYVGTKLADSFTPPSDCDSVYWHVCRYDSVEDKVIPVNVGETNTIYEHDDIASPYVSNIESIDAPEDPEETVGEDELGVDGVFTMKYRQAYSIKKYFEAGNTFSIKLKDGTVVTEYEVYYPGEEKYKKYAYSAGDENFDAVIYFNHAEEEYVIRVNFSESELYNFISSIENDDLISSYDVDTKVQTIYANYISFEKFIDDGGKLCFMYAGMPELYDYTISYKGEELFESVASDEYDAVVMPDDGTGKYYYIKYVCGIKELTLYVESSTSGKAYETEFYKYDEYDNETYYPGGFIEMYGYDETLDENMVTENYTYQWFNDFANAGFEHEYISKTSELYDTAVENSGVNDADGFLKVTLPKYGIVVYTALYYTYLQN